MRVVIKKSREEVLASSAEIISRSVKAKKHPVLGLATGSTPLDLYSLLIERNRQGQITFEDVTTFNLDEYLELDGDDPSSYRYYMQRFLFDHIDIKQENTYLPTCLTLENAESVCLDYESAISAAGGIDLQILGIGSNGHIAFNEPTSSLGSRTRVKTLAPQTIDDNSRLFHEAAGQPNMAITMGIATILEANEILLLATGEAKAEAVRNAIEGPISSFCPATALQLHPNVTAVLDPPAASCLALQDYYNAVSLNEAVVVL